MLIHRRLNVVLLVACVGWMAALAVHGDRVVLNDGTTYSGKKTADTPDIIGFKTDKGKFIVIKKADIKEYVKGEIAAPPPEKIRPLWEKLGTDFSSGPHEHVSAALQWLWDQPEVSVVLSGMSLPDQVDRNLKSACESGTKYFTPVLRKGFETLRREYSALRKVDCTGCGYCMPCPNGVNIPRNLLLYNELNMYGETQQPYRVYNGVFSPAERADNCIECGECEDKCPQHLPIIKSLKLAHAALDR